MGIQIFVVWIHTQKNDQTETENVSIHVQFIHVRLASLWEEVLERSSVHPSIRIDLIEFFALYPTH